jgi:aspartyl-tRNA(Asn)/glutamyl-tRNA(Gln) amidotransferase subunit C
MAVNAATVQKVAKLARLKLDPADVPKLEAELNGILGWIEQLQEVNVDGVEPMTSVAAMSLRWRDDVVSDGDCQTAVLKNAPESNSGFFAVPKVIE